MKKTTPKSDEVWCDDSGASKHMTCQKEWFSYLEKPMQPGVVTTGDDTPHPITKVGEVLQSHIGQKGKLMNVLHVPTITKNLVLVGQILDQGIQVRFMHLRCFIEEEGRVIAQGRRDGRMFILDSSDGGTAMFVKGQKVESEINLWHKRILYYVPIVRTITPIVVFWIDYL